MEQRPVEEPGGSLLRVEDLRKDFVVRHGFRLFGQQHVVRAVDGVSFQVDPGETFGLVGETGSGKSTVARCILRLTMPTSGRIVLGDQDITDLSFAELRRVRRRMQIVFQDPSSSLDPRLSIGRLVREPLDIHDIGTGSERAQRARQMLERTGIPGRFVRRKPHELSGGQRQRVAIARALVLHPELVVLDEPVSALDVSVQAQILNLLRSLQRELTLTYLFIVHDLAVAEYFCDRLAVLYLGAPMEIADRDILFQRPMHPYTVSLLSAAPIPEPRARRRSDRIILRGEIPSPEGKHQGCRFRSRCPVGHDREICGAQEPPLEEKEPGHRVACHFPGELTVARSERLDGSGRGR